jgi:hypothetical protein
MMILSTSISVSARLSPADRSAHAGDGSGSSGRAASLASAYAHGLADHVPHDLRRHLSKRLGVDLVARAVRAQHD